MTSIPEGYALCAPVPSDFATLVRPHLPALHASARGIVHSDDLAWDAVQETLVCLWREPAAPYDLRGWLVRTVVHKSLHVARARRRRHRHERAAGIDPDAPCPLCDPSARVEQAEALLELDAALAALAPGLRSVFLLRQREGLEYAEIAARLALPLGTVRSRLRRARTQLAAALHVAEPARHEEAFAPAAAARTL